MDNQERLKFLEGKPSYNCRFHPINWWHEVGCPHKEWTNEELKNALDRAKKSLELLLLEPNSN